MSERVRSLRLPEGRGRSSARFAWFLCFVLAGVSIWLAVRPFGAPREDGAADAQPGGAVVDTSGQAPVLDSDFALESKGYVIPTQKILLSPKVSGIVVELTFEEGDRVEAGDLLARIEDTDYQADVDRAAAGLLSAKERLAELVAGNRLAEISQVKAELAEAKVTVEKMAADLRRANDLRRRALISDEEFQDIESKHRAQERRVERLNWAAKLMDEGPRQEKIKAARADVSQADAELTKAQWRLDNCTIRAPISGTILRKEAEEGNLVNPIAFSGSRSLCEMADLSKLEVDLSIVERDIGKVFVNQKCVVRPEAYPKRQYEGFVSRLMPIADRAKGAVSVRVKLTVPAEEEGVYLKPEMGAQVTFLKSAAKTPTTSPATSTATREHVEKP